MDHKDSSMTNSSKSECEEKNKNLKGTPRQVGQGDNEDKLFTCSVPQNTNFVPLNGSRSKLGSSNYKESGSQSCTSSEKSVDNIKNACSSNQSGTYDKVNSNDGMNESATASSSRSSLSTNNGLEINEGQCQRYRGCIDRAGGSNLPSTSGTSKSSDNDVYINKENRKRPSSLKLHRPNLNDDSSSDTGNDDYSLGSEDGCIYTYRGGEHLADLPSSFFSLDMGLPLERHLPVAHNYQVQQQAGGNVRDAASRASSPDMDFLEMDFDPGPSCEADTGDESSPDVELEAASNMPEEIEPVRGNTPEYSVPPRYVPPVPPALPPPQERHMEESICMSQPSTSRAVIETDNTHHMYGPYITHINARGEHLLVRRTMSHWVPTPNVHLLNGDLIPQKDSNICPEEYPEGSLATRIIRLRYPSHDVNQFVTPAASFHLTMAKKLMAEKNKADNDSHCSSMAIDSTEPLPCSSTSSISCVEPPRCMVWSEKEACERQVTQIGTSACGATAVINVFNALGVPVNIERINAAVGTRSRCNNAPLPRYLLSRAVAGCTAAELVSGVSRASDGLVAARFFPTHPERAVSLSHWLADWISLGAVPILTMNLQNGCEGDIPDAWHHQMVFGVSPRGVYLCNPAECVRESVLWPRLTSGSWLCVRARDVVSRFTPTTDLAPLRYVPDHRFHTYNVLGQVANVLREWRAANWQEADTRTRFVRIPAAYQAGVTLSALSGTDAHRRLMAAPQLPILASHTNPS